MRIPILPKIAETFVQFLLSKISLTRIKFSSKNPSGYPSRFLCLSEFPAKIFRLNVQKANLSRNGTNSTNQFKNAPSINKIL